MNQYLYGNLQRLHFLIGVPCFYKHLIQFMDFVDEFLLRHILHFNESSLPQMITRYLIVGESNNTSNPPRSISGPAWQPHLFEIVQLSQAIFQFVRDRPALVVARCACADTRSNVTKLTRETCKTVMTPTRTLLFSAFRQ